MYFASGYDWHTNHSGQQEQRVADEDLDTAYMGLGIDLRKMRRTSVEVLENEWMRAAR